MAHIIEVDDLSRRFGALVALDHVNFRAEPGRIYGLVGANGAGKTTLLKHLLGRLRAKSGAVRVFGLDPVRDPVAVLRRVGYLSEERELPEWMRVEELMRYTEAYHPSWDVQYAHALLRTFGLDPRNKIAELSKGMRAQAGLIAAVAHRPDLLILDEPSSGLDAVVRQDILDAIVRTVADDGRTVLFSSHLLEEVERMSDHLTMIRDGGIVLDGPLDGIRAAHHHTHVRFAAHLEQPPQLDGTLSCRGAGRSWSVLHNGSVERFRQAAAEAGAEIVQTRAATLEEIFLARAGRGSSAPAAAA